MIPLTTQEKILIPLITILFVYATVKVCQLVLEFRKMRRLLKQISKEDWEIIMNEVSKK